MSTIDRYQYSSPRLKSRASIVSLQSSFTIDSTKKRKIKKDIDQFIDKFNQVNKSIEIEADQSNFNLIEYERQNQTIKYDPQMIIARLRNIENKAEMKRAQMEIDHRQQKFIKSSRKDNHSNLGTYKDIYNKYLKEKQLLNEESDEDAKPDSKEPEGVLYFQQLKKHPKLLQYTLRKMKRKKVAKVDPQVTLKAQKSKVREKMKKVSPDYERVFYNANEEVKNPQDKGEQIFQNQFLRLFNRKSTQVLKKRVKDHPTCRKMIKKQNEIFREMEDSNLSKDGKKSLKRRFNDVINGLRLSQSKNKLTLPHIETRHHS